MPVIFVHGNNVDAADWYPVRDAFRAAGWTDQELWALSYNGLGANYGTGVTHQKPERDAEHWRWAGTAATRVTNNDVERARPLRVHPRGPRLHRVAAVHRSSRTRSA